MTQANPLSAFIMSDEDIAARTLSIGGSDANTLMSGNADWIYDLWKQKSGLGVKHKEPTLNMLMGTATEELNAAWYASKTGDAVTDMQKIVRSDAFAYPMHATLDGLCMDGAAIWEAKHTGGYDFGAKAKRTIDTVRETYYPQLQHNMMVTERKQAVISVLFDNSGWDSCVVDADPFYQDALSEIEREFWESVQEGRSPGPIESIKAEAVAKEFRDVDMTGNNAFADAAATYLGNKEAASVFESATSDLKNLMESDVGKAEGYGLMLKRDKRGSIRIYVA